MEFRVIPWGTPNRAEIANSVQAANLAQDSYSFTLHPVSFSLELDRYLIANGAYDLELAARELRRNGIFDQFGDSNIILVTNTPYSEEGAEVSTYMGKPRPEFYSEADVFGDGRTSIISTYLWEILTPNATLPVLAPSGRRALQPYLLSAFAMLALERYVQTESHPETLACPNDYCHEIQDIDQYYAHGRWLCHDKCEPLIRKGLLSGALSAKQWVAVRRLLNRARGVPVNDGHATCFISYGQCDYGFARELVAQLRSRGVECWFYDTDAKPGNPTWPTIHEARRLADKMLVVCSKEGLERDGLIAELESQIDSDKNKILPISLDEEWRRGTCKRGGRNLLPSLLDVNYIDFRGGVRFGPLEALVDALHWV